MSFPSSFICFFFSFSMVWFDFFLLFLIILATFLFVRLLLKIQYHLDYLGFSEAAVRGIF